MLLNTAYSVNIRRRRPGRLGGAFSGVSTRCRKAIFRALKHGGEEVHMLARLLVLFIALPLAEIVLLIEIGSRIGTLATLAILVLTAVLGASLAHREGLKVLWRIREKVAQGTMPDEELIDGAMILAAGIVLLTPGLLTDAAGVLLLVPASRLALKRWLRDRFSRRIRVYDV